MKDWQRLAADSHYKAATAIRDALQSGEVVEATEGLEELIDALSRSDRRALESHLMRLMQHIIKWRVQPDRRSRSWRNTIMTARKHIARIQEDTPSLTRQVIESIWQDVLDDAIRAAESEMDQDVPPLVLTWQEVFEDAYRLTP
jgi:hypothetical protein